MQGMNEIMSTIYYCLWKYNDAGIISLENVESDCFVCFTKIMTELGDGFMVQLDNE